MNLPKGKRRQIRDIVLARLTADGNALRRYVKTWQLGQGKANETADWTLAMLPAVRVGWTGGPMQWSAQAQHQASLVMNIEIGLAGSNEGDLMDFWEALEGILFPPNDRSLLDKLQSTDLGLGVFSLSIQQPAISQETLADGIAAKASGRIIINHNVNS